MGRFDGQEAIVTGGATGIGEACCHLFAQSGLLDERAHTIHQGCIIARVDQEPGFSIFNQVVDVSHAVGDDGQTARHGLHHNIGAPFYL